MIEEKKIDKFAIWGFVFAVAPIVFFALYVITLNYLSLAWYIPLIFLALIGLIFSIISLTRIKKSKNLKGKIFAISALIISALQILISIVLIYILLTTGNTDRPVPSVIYP